MMLSEKVLFWERKIGAQVQQVEEPHKNPLSTLEATLFRSHVLIQVEFDEILEPKGLSPSEFLRVVEKFGSPYATAKAIGAAEAFVRQNAAKPGASNFHRRR